MIFETILNQAAQLAAEKEARTEALKEQRRQEVYGDLGKRKDYPKLKRGPKGVDKRNGQSVLDPHRDLIIAERKKGSKLAVIAEKLDKLGVCVTLTHLSQYCIKHTGETYGRNRWSGGSQLDPYKDFLVQSLAEGKSYPEMARDLEMVHGLTIWPQSIGLYIRKKGLK